MGLLSFFGIGSKNTDKEKRYDLNVNPYNTNFGSSNPNLNKYSLTNDYVAAVNSFRFELEKYCNQVSNIKLNFDVEVNRKTGESVIIVSSGKINTSFFNFGSAFTNGLEIHILFKNGIIDIDVDSYYLTKKDRHTLEELYVYDIVTAALFNNFNKIYEIFRSKLPSYPKPDFNNSNLRCAINKSREGMFREKTNLFILYVNKYLQRRITKFDDNSKENRGNNTTIMLTHVLRANTASGEKIALMIRMNDNECIANPKNKHKVIITCYYDAKKPDSSDPNLKAIKDLIDMNQKNIENDALKIYGMSNNGNISVQFNNKI